MDPTFQRNSSLIFLFLFSASFLWKALRLFSHPAILLSPSRILLSSPLLSISSSFYSILPLNSKSSSFASSLFSVLSLLHSLLCIIFLASGVDVVDTADWNPNRLRFTEVLSLLLSLPLPFTPILIPLPSSPTLNPNPNHTKNPPLSPAPTQCALQGLPVCRYQYN